MTEEENPFQFFIFFFEAWVFWKTSKLGINYVSKLQKKFFFLQEETYPPLHSVSEINKLHSDAA